MLFQEAPQSLTLIDITPRVEGQKTKVKGQGEFVLTYKDNFVD